MSNGKSICLVCDRPALARSYCAKHYQRLRRHGDPLAGRPISAQRAFIERLLVEKHTGCVIWPFATTNGGYASASLDGKPVVVSRLICGLVNGDPPHVGMEAAHRCGNGAIGCVNPMCLYWATKAENNADKIRHGRAPAGENHWRCKLTDSQVAAIRSDTRLSTVVAAEYGISRVHVSRIRSGTQRISYAARLAAAEERMRNG